MKRLSPKATPRERHANVAVNAQKVLTTLRLGSAEFNDNQATPQFAGSYFGWIKQHIQAGHPVMIVASAQGTNDADYDHLMLATGITDVSRAALPVEIRLSNCREPDLIAGARPTLLNAVGAVSGLTTGTSYALYRYNDYRAVPTQNYTKIRYTNVTKFVATKATNSFSVGIPSNGVAIFRCLPAGK